MVTVSEALRSVDCISVFSISPVQRHGRMHRNEFLYHDTNGIGSNF